MGGFLVFGEVLDLLVNVFFKDGEFFAAWLAAESELESVVNERLDSVGFVAKKTGRLKRGGVPDFDKAATEVLRDFARGDVKFYTAPPAKAASASDASRATLVKGLVADDFDAMADGVVLAVADKPTTDAGALDVVGLAHQPMADDDSDGDDESDDDDDAMDEDGDDAPPLVPAPGEAYDFADFKYAK